MLNPIRIGLLGAARITPDALIYPARVIPSFRLEAVAARDRLRAEAFAAEHCVARVLDDYTAITSDPGVDLVYNPLPIDAHAQWTIAALEAGKHVLCEKPLAMNAGQARAMLAAAKAGGARLIEAFHYRYHPAFQTCLDWVSAGRIGEIQRIEARFDVGIADTGSEIRHRPERGGGAFMDLGCYPLSWALALLPGEPVCHSASASLTPSGVDEALSAVLRFDGGAEAHLSANMAEGAPFRAEMEITGSRGSILFQNPLAPHHGARLELIIDGDRQAAPIDPVSTYTHQLAAVAVALRTGAPLPTEGDILLRQQATLDAIYSAAGLAHLREAGAASS